GLVPIWEVFDPSSLCYWQQTSSGGIPTGLMQLLNPILFILAMVCVLIGYCRMWLNSREWILAMGLLLLPYCLRGCEMCMNSQGRFASIVFPVFIVMGRCVSQMPAWVGVPAMVLAASLGAILAYGFAAGWPVY